MSTELLLAIIGITAAPVTSWLASKLTRQKYNTEIARLRAEVAAARADANRKELENVRVGNEIIMQNIVHPAGKTTEYECFKTGKSRRQNFSLPSRC